MVSSKTYQRIQDWISQQQEYEATHSEPAPLTEAQRKLLEKLEISLPPEMPPTPEPELGEPNWIGVLQEYRAARQKLPSGIPGGDFMEEPGPTVGGELKWYCRVKIDENAEPFPGPNGGLVNGKQPYFGRKKDAKKYAAKCAVEWLKTNGYMYRSETNAMKSTQASQASQPPQPPQPPRPQVTPQSTPAKKKPKLSSPSPKNPASATAKSELNGAPVLPTSPFNSDEISAVVEVDRLCARLGMPGHLQYRITEGSESGFYNGYADLGILSTKFPIGAGRVENVLGKKAAKEQIAEQLLVQLRKQAAEHDEADKRYYLENLPSKKDEVQVPA
ncbi:uncharacterized protein GGS22DRAFT_156576 [Annulohypoxylon maeteangense]|uniref:uncharacterized protein n=1 Tax=Annulohypoxylon maeteangense TaxID=1927788 RepID=UPI0020088532|nr:uncharacterized protein GGS22DRAFT_156576 [Annulohypoxylon maeteangense]KAI0887264.1 hypothetical protein GGS22DRAFT_156576 [Annulohypoxylon maeteangense]